MAAAKFKNAETTKRPGVDYNLILGRNSPYNYSFRMFLLSHLTVFRVTFAVICFFVCSFSYCGKAAVHDKSSSW